MGMGRIIRAGMAKAGYSAPAQAAAPAPKPKMRLRFKRPGVARG